MQFSFDFVIHQAFGFAVVWFFACLFACLLNLTDLSRLAALEIVINGQFER